MNQRTATRPVDSALRSEVNGELASARLSALDDRLNSEGMSWREWYDALYIVGKCAPNGFGQCTDKCEHHPAASPGELLLAWYNGEDCSEWRFRLALREPGMVRLGAHVFPREWLVQWGAVWHGGPSGFTRYCPFRASAVFWAGEFQD